MGKLVCGLGLEVVIDELLDFGVWLVSWDYLVWILLVKTVSIFGNCSMQTHIIFTT